MSFIIVVVVNTLKWKWCDPKYSVQVCLNAGMLILTSSYQLIVCIILITHNIQYIIILRVPYLEYMLVCVCVL